MICSVFAVFVLDEGGEFMKLNYKIKSVVIFLSFLFIVSCSKNQEERLLSETSECIRDTGLKNVEESSSHNTNEFISETAPDLSIRKVNLPLIAFSNHELSAETTTTEVTLHLRDGEKSILEEYSVSCLYGYLDKAKDIRKDITDNKFTYSISSDMEGDIITIQILGEGGYTAINYIEVKKVLNENGIPIFVMKKNKIDIDKIKS